MYSIWPALIFCRLTGSDWYGSRSSIPSAAASAPSSSGAVDAPVQTLTWNRRRTRSPRRSARQRERHLLGIAGAGESAHPDGGPGLDHGRGRIGRDDLPPHARVVDAPGRSSCRPPPGAPAGIPSVRRTPRATTRTAAGRATSGRRPDAVRSRPGDGRPGGARLATPATPGRTGPDGSAADEEATPNGRAGSGRRSRSPTTGSTSEFAVADGVATVTLNRPEKLNPLTFESYADLRDLVAAAALPGRRARAGHPRRGQGLLRRRRRQRDHRRADPDAAARAHGASRR